MKSPAVFLYAVSKRGAAVLFPIAVKAGNRVVFATSAHTIYGLDRYEMMACDQEGRELPVQNTPWENLIIPPDWAQISRS